MSANAASASESRGWAVLRGALVGALAGLLIFLLGLADYTGVFNGLLFVPGGIGLGAFAAWLRWERSLIGATSILLALVLSLAFIPWTGVMERWVRSDQMPSSPMGAVVVLSGGVSLDSVLSSGGADRLLEGLELVRAGVAPRIVTTRYAGFVGSVRISTDPDQRRLVHLAGADEAWMVVDGVRVTHDEAAGAARLLLPLGVREIMVVTSPAHTRRACATFEKVGFIVHCHPALERDYRTWHAFTGEQRLSVFRALVYELLGIVKYRALGWI